MTAITEFRWLHCNGDDFDDGATVLIRTGREPGIHFPLKLQHRTCFLDIADGEIIKNCTDWFDVQIATETGADK